MTTNHTPALWLIVLIVGLPIFSETAYSPALPEIAEALKIKEAIAEYTLTIYLAGFAFGTLFWGKFSDAYGRKPCILFGMAIYCLACLGCYFAESIDPLMYYRFIQAFGGSVGSVLGQAICRDAFQGKALSQVYATVGSALACCPAIGPIFGGFISEYLNWSAIFLCLTLFGCLVLSAVTWKLPETNLSRTRDLRGIIPVLKRMSQDKAVIGFAFIVAACNGIGFSYYAEGSFYMIELLELQPTHYGLTYIAIASAAVSGAYFSRQRLQTQCPKHIMNLGLKIILTFCLAFTGIVLCQTGMQWSKVFLCVATIICMMGIMSGISITTSNALSLALANYRDAIGTASSLFGGFYYALISLITLGMGLIHSGTLLEMPIYFLLIGLLMVLISKRMI